MEKRRPRTCCKRLWPKQAGLGPGIDIMKAKEKKLLHTVLGRGCLVSETRIV